MVDPLGIVVLVVLVLSVAVGLWFSRQPPPWDEIGGESPVQPGGPAEAPSTVDDEADLRALVAEKRARRLAASGREVASDRLHGAGAEPDRSGPPWAHLDREVVDEARGLVGRKRARLERTGRPVPDEQAELERLLGPAYR